MEGMQNKKEFRLFCKEKLLAMSPEERGYEGSFILEEVKPLLRESQVLSCYLAQDWEVPTWPLIEYAWEIGVQVCCPRVMGLGKMDQRLIRDKSDLEVSRWGIEEPKVDQCREVAKDKIDLVIVPGLGFTREGDRLGYGGGFYDRFLEDFKGFKIGLSFREQLFSRLPKEYHDIGLDRIIYAKSST